MANYESCIKNKKMFCNIAKHFIEKTSNSIEDFDVQIIVPLEKVPHDYDHARKRRKHFKCYWKITLFALNPYGLNPINESEAFKNQLGLKKSTTLFNFLIKQLFFFCCATFLVKNFSLSSGSSLI